MGNAQAARHNMIDGQLEPNQVLDPRIVAALGITPRERFVPETLSASAYVDDNIPLSNGRYLMQPVALGRLLQAAQIAEGEKVLVVAGNTGYSAAVLAHMSCQVSMVEEQRELADRGRRVLSELGVRHVDVQTAAHHSGYPAHAPYQVILVDGAVEVLPEALTDQLADGGRLITLRAVSGQVMGALARAIIIEKSGDKLNERVLFDAAVPVIPSFKQSAGFTF